MPSPKARQACSACRRLKRKCSRDMPACSLCIRLGKTCEYVEIAALSNLDNAVDGIGISPSWEIFPHDLLPEPAHATPTYRLLSLEQDRHFPSSFFLDSDFFKPLESHNALSSSTTSSLIQQLAAGHADEVDQPALYREYFSTTHKWLPFISQKRLLSEPDDADGCVGLLHLCMKLCITDPQFYNTSPAEWPLYMMAKWLCSTIELRGCITLRLLQSLVLVSFYEFSHAIFPAAYLSVGRAARLAGLMGWQDRNAQQLFKPANTWTLREEQRRTWWAIFVLDRLMNMETSGLPFAAPELSLDELLPVNDEDWDEGRVVPSEPLYTASFSSVTTLGPFALACQAAHVLGKVLQHRDLKKKDPQGVLDEAQHLHRALSALYTSIERNETQAPNGSKAVGLSLCISARFLLYNQYACNESSITTSRLQEHAALETEMQRLSLEGIRTLANSTAAKLTRIDSSCPIMARCLYHAATECAWFIREGFEPEMQEALGYIVQELEVLGQRWRIGSKLSMFVTEDHRVLI